MKRKSPRQRDDLQEMGGSSWAVDKGLIEGYDEPAGKRLAPGENVARERVATLLMRVFELGVLK